MVSRASELFPDSRHASHDDELVARDGDVDVLEIVLSGALNNYVFKRQNRASRVSCGLGETGPILAPDR